MEIMVGRDDLLDRVSKYVMWLGAGVFKNTNCNLSVIDPRVAKELDSSIIKLGTLQRAINWLKSDLSKLDWDWKSKTGPGERPQGKLRELSAQYTLLEKERRQLDSQLKQKGQMIQEEEKKNANLKNPPLKYTKLGFFHKEDQLVVRHYLKKLGTIAAEIYDEIKY